MTRQTDGRGRTDGRKKSSSVLRAQCQKWGGRGGGGGDIGGSGGQTEDGREKKSVDSRRVSLRFGLVIWWLLVTHNTPTLLASTVLSYLKVGANVQSATPSEAILHQLPVLCSKNF